LPPPPPPQQQQSITTRARSGYYESEPITPGTHPLCYRFIVDHLRLSTSCVPDFVKRVKKIYMLAKTDVSIAAFETQRSGRRTGFDVSEDDVENSCNRLSSPVGGLQDFTVLTDAAATPSSSTIAPNIVSSGRCPAVLAWHGTSMDGLSDILYGGDLGSSLCTDDVGGYFGNGAYFALEADHATRFTPDNSGGTFFNRRPWSKHARAAILFVVTYSRPYVVTPEKDYHVSDNALLNRYSDFYGHGTNIPLKHQHDAHYVPVKHYPSGTHPAPPRSKRSSGLDRFPTTSTNTAPPQKACDALPPPAMTPIMNQQKESRCNFQATHERDAVAHEIVIRSAQQCTPIAVVYLD
jgi:hypothetical protein